MKILALDVGTSSVKAAVLDTTEPTAVTGPVPGLAQVPYSIDHPTPDAAEIIPDRLWSAVTQAAVAALAKDERRGGPVEGIGLSCLMPALALLDADDRFLGPMWIHLDRRSRPSARRVLAEVGDEFLREVGNRPLPGGISALCFMQQRHSDPSLSQRTRSYLHANGWLGLRLTGERRFDLGNASFTGLFGTCTDRRWSPRWCEYFGVDPRTLPEVVCGSTTIGGLRRMIADEWGLPTGLPVKLGTADTSSALLAAGIGPHDILHSVGTTQVLAALTTTPTPDPRRLTRLLGVGESYVYVAHNPVGGAALGWLHQLAFRDQTPTEFYGKTILAAMDRPTEVVLQPPFLGGDRLEIEPRRAAFAELTLGTDRLDLAAAVLAGMRLGHRAALAAIDHTAHQAGRIFLTGGGAEIMERLLPEYAAARVVRIEEAALRGVARLFHDGSFVC